MNPLRWKKGFETGIETIDNQHRELFKRIDNLTLAMYDGEEKAEVEKEMRNWWEFHVLKTDMQYVPYIKET